MDSTKPRIHVSVTTETSGMISGILGIQNVYWINEQDKVREKLRGRLQTCMTISLIAYWLTDYHCLITDGHSLSILCVVESETIDSYS